MELFNSTFLIGYMEFRYSLLYYVATLGKTNHFNSVPTSLAIATLVISCSGNSGGDETWENQFNSYWQGKL